MNAGPTLIVAVIAIGSILAIGLIALLIYRHERHLRHVERIKALELGRRLPGDLPDPDRELAHKSFSAGLWGAFWGFAFAANSTVAGSNPAISMAVAVAAAVIGVSGIVCGTILSFRVRSGADHPATHHAHAHAPSAPWTTTPGKPIADPDAYDVAAARG